MVGFVGLTVHLEVWTLLFLLTPGHVGISLVVLKKQTTNNRRWKEEIDKHGFRTANAGKWSWYWLFSLSSLLCVLTPCLRVLLPTHHPTSDCLSALDWLTSFVLLFWSHRFSQAQIFVWSFCQYRQRKVFWTLQHHFKDAGDEIPSLATHPQTHRETHTYSSIHIYTCTH